jgi:CNT family concentrative nucleoside transporter
MCSGFATIAGSVLVAYIQLGVNGQALISSCVMSIPASLAVSKLRYPEEEETLTAGRVVIPDDEEHKAANFIHAFANGAWLGMLISIYCSWFILTGNIGIKIAGMIVATLLCIIALVGLIDGLLTWWGRYINIGPGQYDLTLELILGYLFYPVAFLLGVSRNGDLLKVARLIGVKIVEVRLLLVCIKVLANFSSERVRSIHHASARSRLCGSQRPLSSHRYLCSLRLR